MLRGVSRSTCRAPLEDMLGSGMSLSPMPFPTLMLLRAFGTPRCSNICKSSVPVARCMPSNSPVRYLTFDDPYRISLDDCAWPTSNLIFNNADGRCVEQMFLTPRRTHSRPHQPNPPTTREFPYPRRLCLFLSTKTFPSHKSVPVPRLAIASLKLLPMSLLVPWRISSTDWACRTSLGLQYATITR